MKAMRYIDCCAFKRSALRAWVACAVVATGCSALSGSVGYVGDDTRGGSLLRDGSLALSRPVPKVRVARGSEGLDNDPVLGFMPSQHSRAGTWLRIDRSTKQIHVMNGRNSVAALSGDGLQSLKPGTYSIVHKQEAPLWYAPDSYFEDRLLDIPQNNENERFRRGALGSTVLFLDEDTPIHNGPLWTAEVGGVRVDDDTATRLYSLLEVDAVVEVQ
jgi:hypothetical protein